MKIFYLFGWKCPNFLFSLEAFAKIKYKNGKKYILCFWAYTIAVKIRIEIGTNIIKKKALKFALTSIPNLKLKVKKNYTLQTSTC